MYILEYHPTLREFTMYTPATGIKDDNDCKRLKDITEKIIEMLKTSSQIGTSINHLNYVDDLRVGAIFLHNAQIMEMLNYDLDSAQELIDEYKFNKPFRGIDESKYLNGIN